MELRPIDGCRDEEWPGRPAAQATLRGPKRQVRVLAWRPPSIFPNAHRAKHLVPVPRGMEAYYTAAGVDIVDGKIPACVAPLVRQMWRSWWGRVRVVLWVRESRSVVWLTTVPHRRDFVGGGSYKTICDGLAVRHSNFSEFWDSGAPSSPRTRHQTATTTATSSCLHRIILAYLCAIFSALSRPTDVVFLDNPIAGGTTEDYAEDLLPPRAAHHLWVLRFAGEPLSYYPAMGNPRFLAKFNYTIGYHRGLYHLYALASRRTESAPRASVHALTWYAPGTRCRTST